MRVPIALLLVVVTVAAREAAAQTAGDPLNVGLSLTGSAAMDREKDDTSFTVTMNNAKAVLFVENEYAFSPKPNTTWTHEWTQVLMRPGRLTVQIGEPRGEPAAARKDFNEMLACIPEPRDTQGTEAAYFLRCTAFDQARQLKAADRLVVELVVAFIVPIGSAGDAYLGKQRPENTILYVRLKPE